MTREAPSKTRRHPRISLPKGMTAAWYGGGFQQVSRVHTLNSGGLSLSGDVTRPLCSSLMLVFEVPGGVVQAEAVVRNVIPGKEMGLEFTSIGSQARVLLDDLLKRLLRRCELLLRPHVEQFDCDKPSHSSTYITRRASGRHSLMFNTPGDPEISG